MPTVRATTTTLQTRNLEEGVSVCVVSLCMNVCGGWRQSSGPHLHLLIRRHGAPFERTAHHLAGLARQLALGLSCQCLWELGLHADHQAPRPFT